MRLLRTALGLIGLLSLTPAMAQDVSVPPMRYIEPRQTTGADPEVLRIWADRIKANDAAWNAQGNAGLSPAGILWQRYERNGQNITLSIFHGLASVTGCDAGADDKDNEQSWALCPARITVGGPSSPKTTQTQACFQWFPMAPGEEPPRGERSYASIDITGTQATFSATQNGRAVPACARTVRVPR